MMITDDEIVYRRIPFAKVNGKKCCNCQGSLSQKKECKIYVYKLDGKGIETVSKTVLTKLLYCTKCNLFQAASDQFAQIRQSNAGYCAIGFHVFNHNSLFSIVERATQSYIKQSDDQEKKKTQSNDKSCFNNGFRILEKNSNLRFSPFDLYLSSVQFDYCPFCGKRLKDHPTAIPVDQSHIVNVTIKTCREHYFSFEPVTIGKLLTGNAAAKFITVNNQFRFENIARFMKEFNACNSHQYMILGKNILENKETAFIISNEDMQSSFDEALILNYKSPQVRELLTSVFHDKNKVVEFNEKKISISFIYTGKTWVTSYTPSQVIEHLAIKKNGGFVSINPRYQLFNALLYSPQTQRYEIVKVSYDTESEFYFIDLRNYKDFVNKYGKASVSFVSPDTRYLDSERFDYLNSESILHECGYNANASIGLKDNERQAILADIINLGIMTPSDIIGFLEYLYKRRTAVNMSAARSKWKRDIDFVRNYKTNTSSFVIAEH